MVFDRPVMAIGDPESVTKTPPPLRRSCSASLRAAPAMVVRARDSSSTSTPSTPGSNVIRRNDRRRVVMARMGMLGLYAPTSLAALPVSVATSRPSALMASAIRTVAPAKERVVENAAPSGGMLRPFHVRCGCLGDAPHGGHCIDRVRPHRGFA